MQQHHTEYRDDLFKQNLTRPLRPTRPTLYKMQYSIFLHYFYMTTLIYTGSTIRCAGVPYSQIFFSLHSIYYGHSELEFVRQLQWRRTRNYRNDNKLKVISVKKGSMLHYKQLRYCHLQQFSQMCHQKCLNCQIQFQIRSRKALFYAATVESGNRLEMCQELEF